MTPIELMSDMVKRDANLLKMTVSDFADADFFVRPAPGANHAMWQIGHLSSSIPYFLSKLAPDKAPQIPAGVAGKFGKETAGSDDPKQFPSRAELMNFFEQAYTSAAAWVRTLNEQQMNQPSPIMADFFPTVGHVALLISTHANMHIGQLQVIRRKLGKPVLF